MVKLVRLLVFCAGLLQVTGLGHAAESCSVLVPKGLPCPSEAWETVDLEHSDRVARLKRLSAGKAGFEFHEDVVRQEEHGLDEFPTDIPILRVIANQDVFFDSGSDVIRREAYPVLDIIADSLRREPPDVSLFVAGHTDWDGSDDYNMALGRARAAAVSEALLRRNIYQASIYRVSFGEHMPIADNRTWRGKARNRRVEFLFAARTEAIVPYIVKQEVEFCPAHISDAIGSCREDLKFEVERIEIPLEHQEEVIELNKEQEEIEIAEAQGSQPVEIERRRQDIEFRRNQIPIEILDEKIYIEFEK